MLSQHQVFTLRSAVVWHRLVVVDCTGNVMAHGDTGGEWRGNWRIKWLASTLHTTSEHGVSKITAADARTSVANCLLNWRPHQLKWTHQSSRKTKSGFYAGAIKFQTQSTYIVQEAATCITSVWNTGTNTPHCMQSHSKFHWFITHEYPTHTLQYPMI